MVDTQDTRTAAVDPPITGAIAAEIFEAIPDPVMLIDANRTVVAANAAAHDLTNDQLIGRDLILSLRNPSIIEAFADALENRRESRHELVLPAPVQRTFDISALPMPDNDQVVLILHDLTAVRNAELMRADFVANVSHELRSPLSSLIGFIETLTTTADIDAANRQKFLEIMDNEARRMARLIDDLLSLSKVEADEHVTPTDQIDLSHLIKTIVDNLSERAKARAMSVRVIYDGDVSPIVAGDFDELTTVFRNLIDNALSYGQEGTEVIVRLSPVDRISNVGLPGLRIEVRDRGEGIGAEHLPRLTERFYRVDKGRSRSLGGTGLGLAIVKHIVSHHRGRFTIDSTLGEGSVFAVELPNSELPESSPLS